jgi:hypothetical protein
MENLPYVNPLFANSPFSEGSLIDLFRTYESPTLNNFIRAIEEILLERTDEDIVSYNYSQLRISLVDSQRFTYRQAESLRPWLNLPKNKKNEFSRAWGSAQLAFNRLNFVSNPKLSGLIIRLIVRSPFFIENKLSFDHIIESLNSILEIFDVEFPGYLQNDQHIDIVRQLTN